MKFHVYIDMDGVLADFDKQIDILSDGNHPGKGSNDVWKYVKPGFFESLPKMSDADMLWDGLVHFNPTILTATGYSLKTAGREKTLWGNQRYTQHVITCTKAVDKYKVIDTPLHQSILIDDRHKAIDPWCANGGIGILHTSAIESLAQFYKILNITRMITKLKEDSDETNN